MRVKAIEHSVVSHARATVRRNRSRRRLRRRGIVTIGVVALLMVSLAFHASATFGDDGHRKIAERITRALIARDLTPVMAAFQKTAAVDIAQDVRLGAVADRLNALGDLRDVRIEGPGNFPDTQIFVATFTHGVLREQLSFADNRVIGFAIEPTPAQ